MSDGHTRKGKKRVDLNSIFTVDEVEQLIRSLDWALMMDSHEDKPGHPQRLDVMAHREFIKGTRDKLQQALDKQRSA